MFARLIVPAFAATLMLSGAAYAAGEGSGMHKDENRVQTAEMNAANRCTALEKQFDGVINAHSGTKADNARMLRTQAGALCGQGDHTTGIIKLEEALKVIGVEPKM